MAKDLSSARRGRRHVTRDYTSKLRSDINVRETDRRARMATAGLIGNFASGVAEYASALEKNMKGWEELEAGGKELHKKGIEAGTIEKGTDFDLQKALGREKPINKWTQYLTQAPVTDKMSIGKDQFYGINVAQVGKLGDSAGLLVDKDSNKSLYDFLKIDGNKGTASDVMSSLGTMKKARPEEIPSVKTPPVVQNMITENNTSDSSSQSFTSAPKESPLKYPKAPAPDINWDELMSGDVKLDKLEFDDFSEWTAPKAKRTPALAQDLNINETTNYVSGKILSPYGWNEYDEDSTYDWFDNNETKKSLFSF